MNVGLLWYDADPTRDLFEKVRQAADRYQSKYGRVPDTCYIHPSAAPSSLEKLTVVLDEVPGASRPLVRCLPAPNVLLHHLWIGCSEQERVDG